MVCIESNADEVHWVTRDGIIVKKDRTGNSCLSWQEFGTIASHLHRHDPREALYLRAECLGHGNRAAWTQPFWIEALTAE